MHGHSCSNVRPYTYYECNSTRVKSFSVKKHLHVGMEVKKVQKRGKDYTTQKKTNQHVIQEEYFIHLFHTL